MAGLPRQEVGRREGLNHFDARSHYQGEEISRDWIARTFILSANSIVHDAIYR
jgi:hypothetical protein